jgi:tetratricopeptide (TPR) repeat protein
VRRGWTASAIGVIGFAWGSIAAGVAAADPVEDALQAAREDVEQGRCEQAQERLAAIEGLANRARLLGGQCLIRTGRYPEALASLDRARGARDLTAAQVGDVELFRGVALYHLERYAEASAALGSAEDLTSEPAQLALYRGLIALRGGDNERAAPDLEAAALLSPALTEPVASYYAGLAWQGAGRKDDARTAFQRVIALDGEDGAWGRQARELLGATQPHPFSLRAMAGLEYDDNVILRGGGDPVRRARLALGDPGRREGRPRDLEHRRQLPARRGGRLRCGPDGRLFRQRPFRSGRLQHPVSAHRRLRSQPARP